MILLGAPRHHYRSLGSTMDVLATFARDGAPEGTLVIADEQTSGRGRAGRGWQAAPGTSLLCSVLLRPPLPPRSLGALPLIAGLAVAEAIEALTPVRTTVKWPNDIYIGGGKVCGVLMQARSAGNRTEFVNLGIGLNISAMRAALPPGATSLQIEAGLDIPVGEVERSVMDRLGHRYAAFLAASGEPSLDEWLTRARFLGEQVEIEQNGIRLAGTFIGVTAQGALLLETADGVNEIVSGDLTRGPRRRGDT
jgi:BirA family biotin operon repressor/biotin-[acetyl-CoA-carboxylase] ligase